ncbi:hypothetical protein UAY_00134 [Enterococcus moraviensis ATCC BAA-383]|uniref:Uncharacterized protein n=1 Tax=Enterococcus moraviensis ATCC BAA-383 TaxID=1158609 RepID=R2U266_9ENTE|nr:hypothetical protein [Enterococcus moraviensis]EOI06792.1 hypothetical protein UAY_00134 [Enterococcus moraviensis ATCC BAA-383]EOT65129.1 hypothetical protein I586_02863 [Enterococcus moraviensis ATCC BAA-383]
MKRLFKSVVFEMSLYYGVLAVVLPLIYAVTYHVSYLSVFSAEWFAVTVFMYPVVLVLSAIRYGYGRMRKTSHF